MGTSFYAISPSIKHAAWIKPTFHLTGQAGCSEVDLPAYAVWRKFRFNGEPNKPMFLNGTVAVLTFLNVEYRIMNDE